MTFIQSTALWCVLFALIGAHIYAFDKKVGIKIHAKWRKWTSPIDEPSGSLDRGFIYNRSNKVRWFWATIIAATYFFLMIGWRHEDPRIELMEFFLITPATMFGFLIGPLYLHLIHKREELFTTFDEVESGALDVPAEMKKAVNKKLGFIGTWWDSFLVFLDSLKGAKKSENIPQVNPVSTTPVVSEEEENRKALQKLKEFQK